MPVPANEIVSPLEVVDIFPEVPTTVPPSGIFTTAAAPGLKIPLFSTSELVILVIVSDAPVNVTALLPPAPVLVTPNVFTVAGKPLPVT